MKKLKINQTNLPLIKMIIQNTLLKKGKFVIIHEVKRSKSFWKQKNNIKKLINKYDRCYDIAIRDGNIIEIQTETYLEPMDYDEMPEMDWSMETIKEGYFYYSGNGKEFWIEKYEQPQGEFEKLFISTIDHYIKIKDNKEYKEIEKSVVYTGNHLNDYADALLMILKNCKNDKISDPENY